jgi:transcriptional regulator with XRE-family HTH domain
LEIFSARLRWLRERKGFSQQYMADSLGISQSYFGRIENNKGEPNLSALSQLPSLLDESTDFMLGVTDFDQETEKEMNRLFRIVEETKVVYDTYMMHRSTELTSDPEEDAKKLEIARLQIQYMGEKLADIFTKTKEIKETLARKVKEIPGVSEETLSNVEKMGAMKIFENPDILQWVEAKKKDPQ